MPTFCVGKCMPGHLRSKETWRNAKVNWPQWVKGEFSASYRQSIRGNSPPMRHGEWRASTTCHGKHIYSRGELRRPNPSELTWQKPTGEESSTRHGESSQRKKSIKGLSFTSEKKDIISYHTILLEATLGEK